MSSAPLRAIRLPAGTRISIEHDASTNELLLSWVLSASPPIEGRAAIDEVKASGSPPNTLVPPYTEEQMQQAVLRLLRMDEQKAWHIVALAKQVLGPQYGRPRDINPAINFLVQTQKLQRLGRKPTKADYYVALKDAHVVCAMSMSGQPLQFDNPAAL